MKREQAKTSASNNNTDIDITQVLHNWDAEMKAMLEEMWDEDEDEDDETLKELSDTLDKEREEDDLVKKLLAELYEEDILKELLAKL